MNKSVLRKILTVCILVIVTALAAKTVAGIVYKHFADNNEGVVYQSSDAIMDKSAEYDTQMTDENINVIEDTNINEDIYTENKEIDKKITDRRGTSSEIPADIQEFMMGKSMKEGAKIAFADLAYLKIPHYNFEGGISEGEMIVNKKLAEEVLDIFAELYDIQYPIERMRLVDYYNASDFESIEDNNTSAFNYRESTAGTGKLSKHALGCAIDINPQINPYVASDGTGAHQNAKEYWSRDISKWTSDIAKQAYIGKETEIYNIFVNKHNWVWGGSWKTYLDYQHFEKTVN